MNNNMNENTLVFSKIRCKQIAKLRADGSDPYPGYTIVESPDTYIVKQPQCHPFIAFIKGRTT